MERRLRRASPDASHVMVWDRTERSREENLGRFDLTAADALPYLDPDWPSTDELRDEDQDLADVFAEPEDPQPVPRTTNVGPEQVREAACRWLRDLAERNALGEAFKRFRVRIYGPKGMRTLDSGTFTCRDEDHDLDALVVQQSALSAVPSVDREIPTPTFEQVEVTAASRGMKALGDYYAQWGRMVLGSVHQLQGVNNAMVKKLHTQLDATRDQVDELVGAVLNMRAAEMELDEQRRTADRSEDTRAEIAKQALQQLGDAAKAFLASKGVTPEMADVLGTMSQGPT